MTKRQRIINMFNEADWIYTMGRKHKIIHKEYFDKHDLGSSIEYGEKYNDVYYAKRIIKQMGYRVLVGMAFHVIDESYEST